MVKYMRIDLGDLYGRMVVSLQGRASGMEVVVIVVKSLLGYNDLAVFLGVTLSGWEKHL